MTTWDNASLKAKLSSSDAWVARAIVRLSNSMKSIPLMPEQRAIANDDELFFVNLRVFFADNGFFTDRHIAVARQKIRDQYIDYLVTVANERE